MTFTPSLGIVLSVSVIGAVVARFVHTEEVTGSNPVSRTSHPPVCTSATGVFVYSPNHYPQIKKVLGDSTRTSKSNRLRPHVLP